MSIKLDSSLISKKRDGLNDIVGGIGMSMLKRNKNEFGGLRNCILLRTNDEYLTKCLKNSYLIIYGTKNCSNLTNITNTISSGNNLNNDNNNKRSCYVFYKNYLSIFFCFSVCFLSFLYFSFFNSLGQIISVFLCLQFIVICYVLEKCNQIKKHVHFVFFYI